MEADAAADARTSAACALPGGGVGHGPDHNLGHTLNLGLGGEVNPLVPTSKALKQATGPLLKVGLTFSRKGEDGPIVAKRVSSSATSKSVLEGMT